MSYQEHTYHQQNPYTDARITPLREPGVQEMLRHMEDRHANEIRAMQQRADDERRLYQQQLADMRKMFETTLALQKASQPPTRPPSSTPQECSASVI